MITSRLALGTAQFGLNYGIANTNGQIAESAIRQILNNATLADINTLDTAMDYGYSEEYLGNAGVSGWNVITKLPELPKDIVDIECWVNKQVNKSLSKLGVSNIYGLMLHKPTQLLHSNKGKDIWSAVIKLKKCGLVKKIGYSIYDPSELKNLWDEFQPDIVQAPYNIIDRRLKSSGWLSKLYNNNVEVHVRSIFLQGLLLMNKDQRPKKFNKWSLLWQIWEQWLIEQQLTALDACLAFAYSDKRISRIVVGVDSCSHLEQILEYRNANPLFLNFPKELESKEVNLINPSNWGNL